MQTCATGHNSRQNPTIDLALPPSLVEPLKEFSGGLVLEKLDPIAITRIPGQLARTDLGVVVSIPLPKDLAKLPRLAGDPKAEVCESRLSLVWNQMSSETDLGRFQKRVSCRHPIRRPSPTFPDRTGAEAIPSIRATIARGSIRGPSICPCDAVG